MPLKQTGWAISTGAARPEITTLASLHNRKIGVSRLGSGSYVMGAVLADAQGWTPPAYADTVVLHTFEKLREAVNAGEADFFMWEHFTSKRYYDSGEIRRVGEIYTPWSSWKIVASTALVDGEGDRVEERVRTLFRKLDLGMRYFEQHQDEAVEYISTELDYSEEDAREWLKTVKFPVKTEGVDSKVVEKTIGVLRKAGVLVEGKGLTAESMIAKQR